MGNLEATTLYSNDMVQARREKKPNQNGFSENFHVKYTRQFLEWWILLRQLHINWVLKKVHKSSWYRQMRVQQRHNITTFFTWYDVICWFWLCRYYILGLCRRSSATQPENMTQRRRKSAGPTHPQASQISLCFSTRQWLFNITNMEFEDET